MEFLQKHECVYCIPIKHTSVMTMLTNNEIKNKDVYLYVFERKYFHQFL